MNLTSRATLSRSTTIRANTSERWNLNIRNDKASGYMSTSRGTFTLASGTKIPYCKATTSFGTGKASQGLSEKANKGGAPTDTPMATSTREIGKTI